MQPIISQYGGVRYRESMAPPVITALVTTPDDEPHSIDELINAALSAGEKLPGTFRQYVQQIQELHSRLAHGRLHLAVVGEFNRGKSTFINGLIGERLLPTSVLPITTVPTRIIYGPELSCTVRFLNNMSPVSLRSSREAITETLLRYVAEENNPKNKYGVDTVDVTVPSPLLENGTVLIDTPGFGSTYLHNTQTALDALTNCDAALFLLSADPPMTQTEVEFFKQVIHHVPRLFFILNKVDLLTSGQLRQVDDFIRGILAAHLQAAEPPRIFHICARKAERALDQSSTDVMWAASGMESVKVDILNFMAREKYFTLSQAINDRLKETVGGIVALLENQKGQQELPLRLLNREREEISRELDSVRKTVEKEQSLLAAEKRAVVRFLEERFASGKPKLVRQIRDAMAILLDASSCSGDALRNVTVALNKIVPEALGAFRMRLLSHVNRPFKKAVQLHQKAYAAVVAKVAVCLDGKEPQTESALFEKLDALELDIDNPLTPSEGIAPLTLTLHWYEAFFSRERKLKRIHERYDYLLEELLQEQLFAFSRQARQRIDALFAALEELLVNQYRLLTVHLEMVVHRKEEKIARTIEQNNRIATGLANRIEAFRRIMAQLH
jgi:ribosome biogenesis GTPase A